MAANYCMNCGAELRDGAEFCSQCGLDAGEAPAGGAEPDSTGDDRESAGWNWLDPRGPFRSPRVALNYFNAVGLVLVVVGVGLAVAGVEEPYGFLPEPLGILLVVYLLAVLFVGLPVAGVLLLTDNVLGFLRHG